MYFRSMILVTGGTGLVGAHLLRHMVEHESRPIRATYRSEASLEMTRTIFGYTLQDVDAYMNKIEWVKADLFDLFDVEGAVQGVDVIFHCAAFVSFQPSDKELLLKGNPLMTELLINAAVESGVSTFMHVSSVAALGRAENGAAIDETTEWKESPNNSVYAQSKYASELHVWRGMEEGLNVGIVNPTIILGPGPWKSGSSKFFHTFHKGFKYYTTGQTGFVDVRDVVEMLIRIEREGKYGKRYLAVGENVIYRDLFNAITAEYGVPAPTTQPPSWLTGLLWRVEWLRSVLTNASPLVTKETTRSATSSYTYSHHRAVEELGMNFRNMNEIIPEYCQLYVSDLKAGKVK